MKLKLIFGFAIIVLSLGFIFFSLMDHALAEEVNNDDPNLKVKIQNNGDVLVQGAKVTEISTSTITAITSWGTSSLTWLVQLDNGTKFIRRYGGEGFFSDIAKDHIISFRGVLSATAPLTVKSKEVKDWSVNKINISQFGVVQSIDTSAKNFVFKSEKYGNLTVLVSDSTKFLKGKATSTFSALKTGDLVTVKGVLDRTQNNIREATVKIHKEDRKVFEGGALKSIASTTTPTTITVVFKGIDYIVNISEDTTILDKKWAWAMLGNFKIGDHIRVYGAADGTIIEATVVRNVSLPR